jgi:hypothetical protein
MALSSSQFGGNYESMANTPRVDAPLSLSSSTLGSANQATAWRNQGLGGGRPMSLSRRTAGTTYKFDDDTKTALPQSDKGMNRNE